MALNIPFSEKAFSEQSVSVGNTIVSMVFKYNLVNKSWYIDLFDSTDNIIKSGIKVMPNQNLTGRYSLENLPDGDFWCLRTKNTANPVGRNNFGQGKDYELFWISRSDQVLIGVDGVIQL